MWEFDQSLGSRLQSLANPSTFEQIAESIRRTMRILCRHEEPCCTDSRFFRAVYCIQIDQPLFDLFFNSAQGMRAAFYRSPYHGLDATSAVIESLESDLLESGPIDSNPHID